MLFFGRWGGGGEGGDFLQGNERIRNPIMQRPSDGFPSCIVIGPAVQTCHIWFPLDTGSNAY
jgi:hypothetical protein